MAVKKHTTFEVKQASGKLAQDSRGIDVTDETITVNKASYNIGEALTAYINAAALEKSNKDEKDKQADILRAFAKNVRDFFSGKNEYIKTFRLIGKKVGKLQQAADVAHQDRFSFSNNKEDRSQLKKELETYFPQIFEEVTTIAIKDTVMKNDAKRKELTKKLIAALGEDGVKEYFDRSVDFDIKAGLAEKLHKFPKNIQVILDTKLKQSADQVKDQSYIEVD
jgi:hypothetical protein